MFVPKSPTAAKSFRVVVGASHDPPAGNNVLVLIRPEAEKERLRHQNILVELGGHSSAPDVPPFGQFSAGLDVNWHIGDLWGTRDAQATAGLSYSGRYEGAMTYPRDQQDAVTLFPSGFATGADEGRQMMADLVRVSPDYLAQRSHRASHEAGDTIISAERRRVGRERPRRLRQGAGGSREPEPRAIATADSVDKLRYAYGAQWEDSLSATEITGAKSRDLAMRDSELRETIRERGRQARSGIDSVLVQARCKQANSDTMKVECQPWLTDHLRDSVADTLLKLLEWSNRRVPQDSVLNQILHLVPDPDPKPTAMDAIASEISRVVIERLQPDTAASHPLAPGRVPRRPDLGPQDDRATPEADHPHAAPGEM